MQLGLSQPASVTTSSRPRTGSTIESPCVFSCSGTLSPPIWFAVQSSLRTTEPLTGRPLSLTVTVSR